MSDRQTSLPTTSIPAAEYVRMSTEGQHYSIANQQAAIREYAAAHGYTIVKTYSDPGRSGLTLKGRHGLLQLLTDVQSQQVNFQAVLVYDVSRWGRFQDTDEAAFYEYFCRRDGIKVEYCVELFRNDIDPLAAILKNIKRVMAAEYSRDQSMRIRRGQVRIASSGFHAAGRTPFGYRRMLVGSDGSPKQVLPKGALKAQQGERIIFTPGPMIEVRLVRRIFRLYVRHRKKPQAIADRLNSEGYRGPNGRPWHAPTIYAMIDNEEYTGTSVFNLTTQPLGGKPRPNNRENVIRVPDAFPGIISPELYAAAQLVRRDRHRCFPDDQELLARLEYLLEKNGRLSAPIIAADRRGGPTELYRRHFGSLLQAYARIGYVPPPNDTSNAEWTRRYWAFTRSLRMRIFDIAVAHGAKVRRPRNPGGVFSINQLRLTLSVAQYRPSPRLRRPRWRLYNRRKYLPDHMIIARMDTRNEQAIEYFLIRADTVARREIHCGDEQFASWAGHRCQTFDELMDAVMMRATA